jgi:transcriptional regulator with XRE-family HTH domain
MSQGERIKKIRQNLNLSQEDFGKLFEIQKQMVSSIENNKIKLNNEKLEKLLLTYNVNINWLLAEIGDMFIKKQPENLKDEIKQAVKEMIANKELFKDDFK